MIERIQLVVNNHQMSCHHVDKYFYVLRGFKDFIDDIDFPVAHDSKDLNKLKNRYILEEELNDFDMSRFDGFKIVEVIFNFFDNNKVYKDHKFVELKPLDLETKRPIHIFNQIDQLTDVSHEVMDNETRLQFAKDTLKKESKHTS